MVSQSGKRRTHRLAEDDEGPSWVELLDQSIDDLNVKRLTTREKALERLITILRQHNATLPLAPRTEELVDTLIQCINRGESHQETLLSIEMLGLAFINHSDGVAHTDQELLYQDAAEALRQKAQEADSSSDIKAQCYETLSLLTYLVSSQIDAQMIRHEMYNVIVAEAENDDVDDQDNVELVTIAATRAYALMFVVSFCKGPVNADIIQEEMNKMLGELELLMDTPGTLQIAAGQAVALIFESFRMITDNTSDQDELNELIHKLRTISLEQQGMDDDTEFMFEDILSTVEQGSRPYHEIQVNGKSFSLDRWADIIPLNAFQRCLGTGLEQHYKSNGIIWKLFGKSDEERSDSDRSEEEEQSLTSQIKYASNVSKFDKHMVYQEAKKTRTKRLGAARSGKDRS